MLALAPFASRSPFETWILPRRHAVRFEDASLERVPRRWRGCLGDVLRRLDRALEQPPYSLVIHSAPWPRATTSIIGTSRSCRA